MRALTSNIVLATWLLLSAFFFPRTPASIVIVALAALVVAVLAIASTGRPGARYGISVLAIAIAFGALLLPGVSGLARVSDALVAAVLFALSLVAPVHHARAARVA